jgi:hypothetical protein
MSDAIFPSSVDAIVSGAPARAAASWSAIFGGAFVAVSASLIIFAVGSGIGLASWSAWSSVGSTAKALTTNAAIWLVVSQWLSAALGGYIAGRLRARWVGTHTHEVFFRDTAHGLITWSVATVFVAAIFSAALWSAAGAGLQADSGLAGALAPNAEETYYADVLFRPAVDASPTPQPVPRAELHGIVANAAVAGQFPDTDRAYLAGLVAQRAGVPPAEAQKRVDLFIASVQEEENKARAAAEVARKDGELAALYVALSLLVGAFIASVSAALGGRLRDL